MAEQGKDPGLLREELANRIPPVLSGSFNLSLQFKALLFLASAPELLEVPSHFQLSKSWSSFKIKLIPHPPPKSSPDSFSPLSKLQLKSLSSASNQIPALKYSHIESLNASLPSSLSPQNSCCLISSAFSWSFILVTVYVYILSLTSMWDTNHVSFLLHH